MKSEMEQIFCNYFYHAPWWMELATSSFPASLRLSFKSTSTSSTAALTPTRTLPPLQPNTSSKLIKFWNGFYDPWCVRCVNFFMQYLGTIRHRLRIGMILSGHWIPFKTPLSYLLCPLNSLPGLYKRKWMDWWRGFVNSKANWYPRRSKLCTIIRPPRPYLLFTHPNSVIHADRYALVWSPPQTWPI